MQELDEPDLEKYPREWCPRELTLIQQARGQRLGQKHSREELGLELLVEVGEILARLTHQGAGRQAKLLLEITHRKIAGRGLGKGK